MRHSFPTRRSSDLGLISDTTDHKTRPGIFTTLPLVSFRRTPDGSNPTSQEQFTEETQKERKGNRWFLNPPYVHCQTTLLFTPISPNQPPLLVPSSISSIGHLLTSGLYSTKFTYFDWNRWMSPRASRDCAPHPFSMNRWLRTTCCGFGFRACSSK